MPNPKRRHSKARRDSRRAHDHLTAPTLFAGQRLELTVPAPKGRPAKGQMAKSGARKGKGGAAHGKAGATARAPVKATPARSAAKTAPRASNASPLRVSAR